MRAVSLKTAPVSFLSRDSGLFPPRSPSEHLPAFLATTVTSAIQGDADADDRAAFGPSNSVPPFSMGVDPQLGSDSPSVEIHGEKFYYGKDPEFGEFLVSHPTDGKRYWCFSTKAEMIDFLENLPESADPPTMLGMPLFTYYGIVPDTEYYRVLNTHQHFLSRLLELKRASGMTFRYEDHH